MGRPVRVRPTRNLRVRKVGGWMKTWLWQLLKRPFFGRFMVPWRNPLSDAARQDWTIEKVVSRSGADLVAWFAHARRPARATVVLGHPMGKDAKGFFLTHGYADLLRDHGLNVVVFDFNGFGESPQGSFAFQEDVLAVGRVAKQLTPTLPIAYHGISLGGQWGALAMASAEHPFELAIIESAATSLPEFWVRETIPRLTFVLAAVLTPGYLRRIHAVERFREARGLRHVLFVYSRVDDWTPLWMGERYREACPVPSTMWVADSAEHARIMRSNEREAYIGQLLSFYEAHLGSAGR